MITINSNYGSLMLAEIDKQGHSLSQVDNAWTSSNDEAVQAIIDNYDPLPEAKAEAIAAIKARAGELIEANMPSWKQSNTLREIVSIKGNGGTMSASDTLAVDTLEDKFAYLDAIRIQSDNDEASINAQTDWKLCVADFTVMEAIS